MEGAPDLVILRGHLLQRDVLADNANDVRLRFTVRAKSDMERVAILIKG